MEDVAPLREHLRSMLEALGLTLDTAYRTERVENTFVILTLKR